MNIIGVNKINSRPAIEQITGQVITVLDRFYNKETKIQIEFKYAKFKAFCESGFGEHVSKMQLPVELKKSIHEIMECYVLEQNAHHFQTLKKLSYSSILILNSLGKIYRCESQFEENEHKKFYKIREFLINLCRQNKSTTTNPWNFYNKICLQNPENRKFNFVTNEEMEMRLDIFIKNGTESGRYSYLLKDGWTKNIKENLIREKQYDLMISERLFRLAIKREDENALDFDTVKELFQRTESKNIMIRCKRTLRIVKDRKIQFSLSQIYQPNSIELPYEDVRDAMCIGTDYLDETIFSIFQNFYSCSQQQAKYQVEAEFTQIGVENLVNLRRQRRQRQIQMEIDGAISELYGFFYLDHNIKKRESLIMEDMKGEQNGMPQCRLENQFGSYMHDIIFERITQQ